MPYRVVKKDIGDADTAVAFYTDMIAVEKRNSQDMEVAEDYWYEEYLMLPQVRIYIAERLQNLLHKFFLL